MSDGKASQAKEQRGLVRRASRSCLAAPSSLSLWPLLCRMKSPVELNCRLVACLAKMSSHQRAALGGKSHFNLISSHLISSCSLACLPACLLA